MKRASVMCVLILAASLTASPLGAGEWLKSPFSNPFRKSEPSKVREASPNVQVSFDDEKPPPRSEPRAASASRAPASGPSAWQKMKGGTSRFFAGSKSVLMPWTKKKPPAPVNVTGTQRVYYPNRREEPKESGGWFSWLYVEEAEPQKAATVVDWLAQPRP